MDVFVNYNEKYNNNDIDNNTDIIATPPRDHTTSSNTTSYTCTDQLTRTHIQITQASDLNSRFSLASSFSSNSLIHVERSN